MGFLTNLRGRLPAAETRSFQTGGPVFPDNLNLGSISTIAGTTVSQMTALQIGAVRRAVTVRSIDVARCRPLLQQDDGTGKKVKIVKHPLIDRFQRPNPWQSWFEFVEQLHGAFVLKGNAYFVRLRNGRGYEWAWLPVNPDLVTVYESPGGLIFYNVSRAGMWLMAALGDEPAMIPAEDMFHLRDMSINTLLGLQRIMLARNTIGLALAQEEQAARWAGNGARPSGVLQTDKKLDPEAALRLKRRWTDLQSGVSNAGSTAVLEDGVKWTPMQLTGIDIQFMGQREFSIKDIARAFDVPLHKMMEADSQTRATIAELNSDYVQSTVMGDLTRWERRFEHAYELDQGGIECKFDETELLRADVLTMRNIARLGFMSGLTTQNEARDEIGYGPMPGGDVLMPPVNMAPNGSAADGTAPGNGGRPTEGTGEQPGDKPPTKRRLVMMVKEASEPVDDDEIDVDLVTDDDLRALFSADMLDGVV